MSLLQPSFQLGRARRTQRQFLADAQLRTKLQCLDKASKSSGVRELSDVAPGVSPFLVGTAWGQGRKKRKRRPLKVEKVLFDPNPKCVAPEETLVSGDSESDSEGTGGDDNMEEEKEEEEDNTELS